MHRLGSWRFFLFFLCGVEGGSARKERKVDASGEPGLECVGVKSLRVCGSGSIGTEFFCLSHLKAAFLLTVSLNSPLGL